MNKITAYLMSPCRGRDGDDVLPEVKWANVQKAIEVGNALRVAFPCLDLFVPHEHEEVIDQLWQLGLSGDKITDATAQIAARKDISFSFEGNGVSAGMEKETKAVHDVGKQVIHFVEIDEELREGVAPILLELRQNVCQPQEAAEER